MALMVPDAAVPRPARIAIDTGECPEWQRELTVNQPPHGFAGSSPASPTIYCLSARRDFSRAMDPLSHCFAADRASKYMPRISGPAVGRDIHWILRCSLMPGRRLLTAVVAGRRGNGVRLIACCRSAVSLEGPSHLMPRKRSILKTNTKNSTFSEARFFFVKQIADFKSPPRLYFIPTALILLQILKSPLRRIWRSVAILPQPVDFSPQLWRVTLRADLGFVIGSLC